jgi:hypothetical protein
MMFVLDESQRSEPFQWDRKQGRKKGEKNDIGWRTLSSISEEAERRGKEWERQRRGRNTDFARRVEVEVDGQEREKDQIESGRYKCPCLSDDG